MEIEWCRTTETPIFGIQGNDLTDQIERKGRNESPYGIPQDAFFFPWRHQVTEMEP